MPDDEYVRICDVIGPHDGDSIVVRVCRGEFTVEEVKQTDGTHNLDRMKSINLLCFSHTEGIKPNSLMEKISIDRCVWI